MVSTLPAPASLSSAAQYLRGEAGCERAGCEEEEEEEEEEQQQQ